MRCTNGSFQTCLAFNVLARENFRCVRHLGNKSVISSQSQESDHPGSFRREVSSRSAVRSTAFTLGAQAAKFVLGLILTALLARLLNPAEYGLVAMVAVVTGFVGIFKDGGLTVATVQRADVTHGQVSTLFWINSALGLTLALIVTGLSPFVGWLYQDPDLVPITVGLSLPFLFWGLAAQPTALLQREMRFKTIGAIEIASFILSGAIGLGAAVAGWGVWALVMMAAALGALNAVLVFIFCGWLPSLPSKGTGIRAMLRFGGALTLTRLVDGLASSLDVILLGRLFSPAVVGLYTRSQTLMLQPLAQLMTPLQQVALPLFSSMAAYPDRLHRAFGDLLMTTAVASSFLTVFLVVGSDWIVSLFLGNQWSDSATILRLMFGPTLSLPLTSICLLLLTSLGRGRALVRWSLVRNSIIAGCILLGISWGANGVALALSVGSIAVIWPSLAYFVSRECETLLPRILGASGVAVAFSFTGVALLYASREFLGLGLERPLLGLSLLVVANLVMHSSFVAVIPSCKGAVLRMMNLARDAILPQRV